VANLSELLTLLLAQLLAGAGLGILARVVVPGGLVRGAKARGLAGVLLAADVALPGLWFVLARGLNPHLADGLIPWQILLFLGQIAGAVVLAPIALLRAARRRRPVTPQADPPFDPLRRRVLLRSAALTLPLLSLTTGAAGAAEASRPARLRRRTVVLPDLPAGLDGLRVLHLSDTHLWHFVTLADLDAALAPLQGEAIDLVCVTGDVADDLDQLAPALDRIAALRPRLGCFACLGNHEYARGLRRVLAAFGASSIELLRTGGRRLQYRDADFYVIGIDDPRGSPGTPRARFFAEQVAAAMQPVPPGSFVLALSHRPGVFPRASAAGISLTLAGHTHGGQAAVLGRSVLELAAAEPYPWGVYEREGKVLHVTCGAGHWFPIRLGCPPELVLLELQRS
jgi:uncharacterized protein